MKKAPEGFVFQVDRRGKIEMVKDDWQFQDCYYTKMRWRAEKFASEVKEAIEEHRLWFEEHRLWFASLLQRESNEGEVTATAEQVN